MLAPFKLPLAVFINHQLKSFSLLQGEFGCWNRTGIVHRCSSRAAPWSGQYRAMRRRIL